MIQKIKNNPIFEELYCLILCIISLLCWRFSSLAGMISILLIATASLIVLNDFKYMIPCSLFFIFSNGNGYDSSKFPIPIMICGGFFLIVLIIYMIRNGFHLSKIKSCKGIFLLSISCILPILWHNIVPKGKEVLYLLIFTYAFYLLVYLLFASSLKKDSFSLLIKSMGYLGTLIAFECVLKVIELKQEGTAGINIFMFWYYLGWGLCNEAGIMMCVAVPFVFIGLMKTKSWISFILSFLKIGMIAVGMVLTTSRGTILFGYAEMVLLIIWSIIFSKKRIAVSIGYALGVVLALVLVQYYFGIEKIMSEIVKTIFSNKLDDNGRLELWKSATSIWSKDFVRMTFGSGLITEFINGPSSGGWQQVYVVYHSTFFETLAAFGNLGVAFLIIHFVEKYKQLFKLDKAIAGALFIGYIMVDIYGMIDNTYTMYYYMIPLMIIMASLDNIKKEGNESYEINSNISQEMRT